MDKYTFIWGIKPKNNFVNFAVLGKTITNPKRIDPKLKNFTAVVPVLVVCIQVVKNTQEEKIDRVNNIIFIIVNICLYDMEVKINIEKEIIEKRNKT